MKKFVRFSLPDREKFFQTLRNRVNGYFRQNNISRNGDWRMYLKTLVMMAIYLTPFVLILTNTLPLWSVFIMYAIMGVGLVGIGMSVMHDANHGSYSKSPMVNKIMAYSMNILGGNAFNWQIQHNVMHHTYTNIYGLDEDIEDKPFLRLSPDGKLKKYHRYQHIYAILLYGFATYAWILWKDFLSLAAYHKEGRVKDMGKNIVVEYIILTVTKIIYWGVFFVLPIVLTSYSWYYLLAGFLLMHYVGGFIMTVVFQLAHVVQITDHFQPNEEGNVENVWAMHQLATTANFARNNKLISWYVGGLNFQVEHHLFPNICHVHYPEVAKIVKKTAEEFGVQYNEFKTFGAAFKSHFQTLKALGRDELQAKVLQPQSTTVPVNN
jgi:linoleoyl-CoA desaturase